MHLRSSGTWDGAPAAKLAREWGVPVVKGFPSVGSTNDEARRLAAIEAPCGTVVVAEEQRTGRGRRGRSWLSPPGLGVWLSVILRRTALADLALLPLVVGILCAQALRDVTGSADPSIKWPNDLLANDRKLGGILCETVWEGGVASVVVGVGINVLHAAADFPRGMRETATSLRLATDSLCTRREVARVTVGAVRRGGGAEGKALAEQLPSAVAPLDALRDRWVAVVSGPHERVTGVAGGIRADGALLVRTPGGGIAVRSGSVRLIDHVPGVSAVS